MVCYHQNPIRRTLRLKISPFLMMTNLGYLEEKKISSSNQSQINQTISNVKHEKLMDKNIISYHIIYIWKPHMYNKIDMTMITMTCMRVQLLDPINISPFGNIKKKRRGIPNNSRLRRWWGKHRTEVSHHLLVLTLLQAYTIHDIGSTSGQIKQGSYHVSIHS